MKKFYITTPIYYVNDKPHLGHAYTTLVADMFARYHRMLLGGDAVYFLTGTDEHGVKIAQAAEKQDKTPQAFADEVSATFQLAWDRLAISHNDFIRTTEPRHEASVRHVFNQLKDAVGPSGEPVIYKGTYEGLYCYGCEAYKTPDEVEDRSKCPLHPTYDLAHLKEENWFFRLSDFGALLREKIENGTICIEPALRQNEVTSMIKEGLQDIAISRANVKWGIPVPFDKEQTIYVWVDALINYISALGYGADETLFKKFWPADFHVMAKDILKFHAIIWPALLSALQLPLPKTVFAHGFFTIDGQKMSKSIGNVIDPNQLVDHFGSEAARYLIISQFPFGQDGDIKAEDFKTKFNADLANGLGNLTSRVLGMIEKYYANVVPAGSFIADLDMKQWWKNYDDNFSTWKIFENVQDIMRLVAVTDGFIAAHKPWELSGKDDKMLADVLYTALELIRHISIALVPIMPETAEAMWKKMHLEDVLGTNLKSLREVGGITAGRTVEKGEALFMRK